MWSACFLISTGSVLAVFYLSPELWLLLLGFFLLTDKLQLHHPSRHLYLYRCNTAALICRTKPEHELLPVSSNLFHKNIYLKVHQTKRSCSLNPVTVSCICTIFIHADTLVYVQIYWYRCSILLTPKNLYVKCVFYVCVIYFVHHYQQHS